MIRIVVFASGSGTNAENIINHFNNSSKVVVTNVLCNNPTAKVFDRCEKLNVPCSLFEKELGVKIVFMGFGLDSDNLHSPNEKYDIVNFYKGIETIPYFHQFFAEKQD